MTSLNSKHKVGDYAMQLAAMLDNENELPVLSENMILMENLLKSKNLKVLLSFKVSPAVQALVKEKQALEKSVEQYSSMESIFGLNVLLHRKSIVDDLINLLVTEQAISHQSSEKFLNEGGVARGIFCKGWIICFVSQNS